MTRQSESDRRSPGTGSPIGPSTGRSAYPWFQVGIGWLVYGLGIAPAYYSWGFFAPEILRDLDLDRTRTGLVFSVFTFVYSAVGPLVGLALDRFGLRRTVTVGALVGAAGLFMVSRAENLWQCLIGYSLLGGIGIGFCTILPAQTLAARWFIKQRARALAILMTAGGIVGLMVPLVNRRVLEIADWRQGWLLISLTMILVAAIAAIFLRDSPEAVGLLPDGVRADGVTTDTSDRDGAEPRSTASTAPDWNALDAIKTPHFALLTLCGIAFSGPWGVVIAHGRLHFEDLGLTTSAVAVVLSSMILISTFGRLCGALGDYLAPSRVLGLALGVEALGLFLLLPANSIAVAQAATLLIGVGFGGAYVSTAATFAHFFGRRAFATTAGTRLMIGALVGPAMPTLAGWTADMRGSYNLMWIGLGVVAALAGVAIFVAKPPSPKLAQREPWDSGAR